MAMMGCGHNKAVRLFADLEQIGLIERRKQGRGVLPVSMSRTSSCPQRPGNQRKNQIPPATGYRPDFRIWEV